MSAAASALVQGDDDEVAGSQAGVATAAEVLEQALLDGEAEFGQDRSWGLPPAGAWPAVLFARGAPILFPIFPLFNLPVLSYNCARSFRG